jgi:hypothetical protein
MRRILAVLTASVVMAALPLIASGNDETGTRKATHKTHKTTAREVLAHQRCSYTFNKIDDHRETVWEMQKKLRRSLSSVSKQPISSCPYARWVEGLWWNRRVGLKKEVRARVIPATNDWVTAVRIVQKIYPGTSDWMLYISKREGGYGPWVWYGGRHWSGYHIGNDFLGADTVGGWMQFRYSTFAPYWRQAQEDLRRRGFILPDIPNYGGPAQYQAWLWPLGQALTAGYMRYTGKDGCHWCL